MNPSICINGKNLSFKYGDETICFERRPRKNVKSRVLIKVHPDGHVVVTAPEERSDDEIIRAVQKRSRWIYRHLHDSLSRNAHKTPRQYVSGESHYYLGKQYLLKVIEHPHSRPCVKLLRGKIEVVVREKDPSKVQALLAEWYRVRAKAVFSQRMDEMLKLALWVSQRPPMHILYMQTRWGSCSPAGRISLNPYLVKAPRECIDYVILHELCHLVEHNHSKRFYRLMSQVMPNWEVLKTRLDSLVNNFIC